MANCWHQDTTPVTLLDGETVALLCTLCHEQLPLPTEPGDPGCCDLPWWMHPEGCELEGA